MTGLSTLKKKGAVIRNTNKGAMVIRAVLKIRNHGSQTIKDLVVMGNHGSQFYNKKERTSWP
jgi:hypothetical protein